MSIKQLLKNRKILVQMFVSLIIVLALAISSILLIDNEKTKKLTIEEFKEMAKEYYKKKYDMDLQINEIGYICTDGLVSEETNDMYIKVSNGSTIIYIEETEKLYDNKQAKEINTNIEETVLKEIFENVASDINIEEIHYENIKINEFSVFTKQGIKGSYYNSLFDGDIKKFLENEEVVFDGLRLFAICEDRSKCESIKDAIIEELKNSTIIYEESNIEVRVLTKECYEKYLNGEYRLPDIDMLKCFAKFKLGENEYSYLQNYIEVADGIYITSSEKGFVLEKGDITLEKCESEKIALYKVEFSERVKEFIRNKTYNELNVYVRYDLEETQVIKENIAGGKLTEEDAGNIKLYYYKKEDESKYFDLYSEMSDGEYAVLEEGDYVFFEIEELEEKE